jgi:hypothetical protein
MKYPKRNADILPVIYADSPSFDAFGRLRVSQVTTRTDTKQVHDDLPLFIDKKSEGRSLAVSHVYTRDDSSTKLVCSSVGHFAISQTKRRFNYQTGKSQEIFMTFENFDSQKGYIKRIGYFSSNFVSPYDVFDGLFLESTEDGVYACIYKNGNIIERTHERDFSGINDNKFEELGIDIDWNKSNIFNVDFEWLGVGRVRWCLVIDGEKIPFHYSNHANNTSKVYMQSPNKPLRWEVRCVSTPDVTGSFDFICGTVGSEGSINEVGKTLSIHDAGVPLAITVTTLVGVLGIRLQQDKADALIDILSNSLMDTSNSASMWQYILNPTKSGTVPTWTNYANSAVQQSIPATSGTILSGGTVLGTGHIVGKTVSLNVKSNSIKLGVAIDGTQDEIWIAFKKIGAGNVSLNRAIDFQEQI